MVLEFVVGILGDFLEGEKQLVDSVDFVENILQGHRIQNLPSCGNRTRVAILCKPNYAGSVDSNICFQRLVWMDNARKPNHTV